MRLLLAEDEEMLSSILVTILRKNKYSVDAVFNGCDALEHLETETYDGAILDIMMPKLDGISVLKTIRSHGNKIPVLMLTAKAEIDDKVYGLDCGANDYLSKPFDTNELLARIRAMTKNNIESIKSTLTLGNVILDRKTLEMSSNTNCFRLATKEFQLMELFMCNPNRSLFPQQIAEKIWSMDADGTVVKMYTTFLNKKLYALRADIQIITDENDAYMLEEVGYE